MGFRQFLRHQLEESFFFGGLAHKPSLSQDEAPNGDIIAESELRSAVLSKVLDGLTLSETQRASAALALTGMIHMAAVLIRRAPDIHIERSTTFGTKREHFEQTLLGAGISEETVKNLSDQAVKIIVERLHSKTLQERPSEGKLDQTKLRGAFLTTLHMLPIEEDKKESVERALLNLVDFALKPENKDVVVKETGAFGLMLVRLEDELSSAGVKQKQIREYAEGVVEALVTCLFKKEEEFRQQSDTGLAISSDQVERAKTLAHKVCKELVIDDKHRAAFDTAVTELAESRADMLRIKPSWAVNAAEIHFTKRNQLLEELNAINPGQAHANNLLMKKMLATMDVAFGRSR
jgi:hypothetical protein